ncbi:Crp/Fnr family transcriptional regulator [Chryseobacterium sp. CKR4-1]|uniref:Crp/Fnr family transcriptional regulator n=1 Tax=Chryseobacterium sp. CKR4-1 TaxID=3068896 RepID=UPI0027964582|nr:Crp/Fnr family transcriptional regulator [Chryseobacterium sp. CKR4-1]MDQ1805812.1 Crp/Fnr family transcriptional regulator [Chryseobacterium sp. CKR4-1]WBV56108.1 Crp/Fnr family transcriptional regulator [Chryseobacterium daecheongense]
MKKDIQTFHQFLNSIGEISTQDFDLICQYMEIKEMGVGTILLQEGKIAKDLFFVLDGILKIVSTNEKGNEVIHFFIKENKFCTILYSFTDEVISREEIIAATSARVLVFSRKNLNELFEKLPHFKNLIENITQKTLMEKIKARNHLMGEEATIRYHKFISDHPDLMLKVPLSDVASYLGITQQSLSRIRKNINF